MKSKLASFIVQYVSNLRTYSRRYMKSKFASLSYNMSVIAQLLYIKVALCQTTVL